MNEQNGTIFDVSRCYTYIRKVKNQTMRLFAPILAFVLCLSMATQNASASTARRITDTVAVRWYTIEEALELNAKQPRKIIMDVYTDWCGWCKVLDRKTFSNPVIAKYLNENFYPVKFNAEQTGDVLYMGTLFKNKGMGSRSAHDFVVALTQGKLSYPTMVFFDGDSKPLTVVPGFMEAKDLEPILVFLLDDYYKKQNYESFLATFKGSF